MTMDQEEISCIYERNAESEYEIYVIRMVHLQVEL